jgi:hypothetical protein
MNGTREPRSPTANKLPKVATLTGVIGNEAE